MKLLPQALTQSATAKASLKEDYKVLKVTQPILPQLEEIVASLQQSKREMDDQVDANWFDGPSERQVR